MKTTLAALLALASLASALLVTAPAQAGWTPRLRCEGLVVDGDYSFDRGFSAYQLVIRDRAAVAHLEKLVGHPLANAAGELVVRMGQEGFAGRFDGSMRARLGMFPVKPGASTQEIYDLLGQWQDGGRYQVQVTRFAYSPGSSYQNPERLGDWVFSDCKSIR